MHTYLQWSINTEIIAVTQLVITALLFQAGYIAILSSVLVDIVGLTNIEMASGFLVFTTGLANALLHPLSGRL